jgi:hypothetical protein
MSDRHISRILPGQPSVDGDGVRIHRLALTRQPAADPFLLLDELRSDDRRDFVGGFPPHPHRGMETLTVMLKGGLVHQDHLGNRGEIRAGGAQWMSAGRGIIHGEMPTLDTDGLHGFQLWINLPAAEKMKAPDYRDVHAAEIPRLEDTFGSARLIAGAWQIGAHRGSGPLRALAAEAGVADLSLHGGASVEVVVEAAHSLSVYVFDGALSAPRMVDRGHLAFTGGGEALRLVAGAEGARLLLLRGRPLREPIAGHGPFVMNTPQQIEEAIRDYQQGRLTD